MSSAIFGNPFATADATALANILSHATPQQLWWLAGYTAGLAQQTTAPVATVAAKAIRLGIVYLSESGNAEKLAGQAARLAKKRGAKTTLLDAGAIDVTALQNHDALLVIAATWGDGEPPARSTLFYNALLADTAPHLTNIPFAVLALGDRAYPQFCATGQAVDTRLEQLGAARVLPRVDCDVDYSATATEFFAKALALLVPDAAALPVVATLSADEDDSPRSTLGEVVGHVRLNSQRSSKETYHIELQAPEALTYLPGDALEVTPSNDPTLIETLQRLTQCPDAQLHDRDVTTLSAYTLEQYAQLTGVRVENPADYIKGRRLWDLLADHAAPLNAEQWQQLTRPLPARAYSIASARSEVGDDTVHLTVAAVRYSAHGRQHGGVASTFLADRAPLGHTLPIKVRSNKHFRLPAANVPIIMVGAGTGIAPYRAFLQERRATGATGSNRLFFGDRRYNDDFLYQTDWQEMHRDGVLTHMHVAFSRDTPHKEYVQHRLYQERQSVVDDLNNGAVFYVCGDAKNMAPDVRAALIAAYGAVQNVSAEAATAYVQQLEQQHRYLQDVY